MTRQSMRAGQCPELPVVTPALQSAPARNSDVSTGVAAVDREKPLLKQFVVVGMLLLASLPVSAGGWTKSLSAAQAEAKKKNQIIFVDLFANWCGWCHRMEREVFPTERFQKVTKDMVLLRVNTEDGGEGSRLAQQYRVTQLPTFLMLAPDGMLVGIIRGYAPAEPFSQKVAEQEQKYKSFLKEVSSEKNFANDHQRRLDLAVDYISRRDYKSADSRLRSLLATKNISTSIRDAAYYNLGDSLHEQKRYDEAMKLLNEFFRIQKKGASLEKARLLLGQLHVDRGNYKAALAELQNFKRTFPGSPLMPQVEHILPQLENAAARTN